MFIISILLLKQVLIRKLYARLTGLMKKQAKVLIKLTVKYLNSSSQAFHMYDGLFWQLKVCYLLFRLTDTMYFSHTIT